MRQSCLRCKARCVQVLGIALRAYQLERGVCSTTDRQTTFTPFPEGSVRPASRRARVRAAVLVRAVSLGLVTAFALGCGRDKISAGTNQVPSTTEFDAAAAHRPATVGVDAGGGAERPTEPVLDAGGTETSVCPPPANDSCVSPPPSFANTIAPILASRCSVCHDPNLPVGPWPLEDYQDVMAWADMIATDLATCSMPPPDGGTILPERERQLLFAWLACNAPNN